YYVNNNTSTSIAEFAAFNQALHDAATNVANGEWFLQLNIKYYSNNGGAEQLWICSDCTIDRERQVPEPGSLPLLALGMLIASVSVLRARRRR
ncbi:MAG TPA: PEP-CTERM sorting domain-containing protein, partial [Telluria sp.]